MGNHHRCRRRHGNGNNPCRSRSRLPYYYGLLSSVQSGTDTAASSERDRKRKPGSHGSRSVFYGIDSFFCRSDCGASSPRFLLMNNAGTMETGLHITDDGFERTVSVNYLGPYLLTRNSSGIDTRSPYCKHGFLHVCDRTPRFSRFLPAGKKGKFLANPCLQQYKTGFDAVYDRTFGTPP